MMTVRRFYKRNAKLIAILGWILGAATGVPALVLGNWVLFALMWTFIILGAVGFVMHSHNQDY